MCPICFKAYTNHAITQEPTCFEHGNPDGDELEQAIHAVYSPTN